MVKFLSSLLIALFYCISTPVIGQSFSFTEQEAKQIVENATELVKAVNNGFTQVKSAIKGPNGQNDSSLQSRISIFPAKTKSTAHINYRKQLIFYREETETDIYSATQALKPLLRGNDYVEIVPMQQGTYTFTSRAFSNKNVIIDIAYKVEKEKKYSTITIIKADDYPSTNPNKVLTNNWEAEKKGLGFLFKANGKDSVTITKILTKSPALLASLKAGDLITAINNETVSQKTTVQVANLIAISPDKVVITYLRNGNQQKAVLQKDFAYKYDKTCLSGNCINGTGIAMSNTLSGVLMEGKFSDGQLVEGSWYYNAKSQKEKGLLFRKGKIMMGRFFSGNSYEPNKPDGGWWYQVTNHDVVKNSDIIEKTLNGYVFCYSNKTFKYLWEGEFENGKKSGDFAEYLYDKGFYWSYYIDGNEKHFHKLKKLTSDKLDEQWLNDDALKYNETTKTWSGWFLANLVNSNLSEMTRLENVSSYNDIETKALAANSPTSSGNSGNTNTAFNKPKEKVKQVKVCSHCNGKGVTYTSFCSDCNNTGMTKYLVGTNSWNATSKFCGCVGYGMLGWNYIKNSLAGRKKVCNYCNGKGVEK